MMCFCHPCVKELVFRALLVQDFLKDLQEAAGVDILGETTVNNISYLV